MDLLRTKLVFFGTPAFAAATLETLVSAGYAVAAAVTAPDRPVGRSSVPVAPPVKLTAIRLGIPVLQPGKLSTLPDLVRSQEPLLGVLFAYGRILPPRVLEMFPRGILNIHPSLLPRYRGPAPVAWAVMDGATATGVTVIVLDDQMDHGPILGQRQVAILPAETAEQLTIRLAEVGTTLLLSLLPRYLSGSLRALPQTDAGASVTRELRRDDGAIVWERSARELYNQYRACNPWPGFYTWFDDRRLKLLDVEVHDAILPAKTPGTLEAADGKITVATVSGALVIGRVQLEGGVPLAASAWLRGHPDAQGTLLRSLRQPIPTRSPADG
ncbi:MAG: methionyl-tRNA formyltransferase [bacterium]|nr:methionyl-tRNA formyltransferase [bacterium]